VRRAVLTAALAVSTGVIAACSGGAPSPDRISVSNGGCGSSWQRAGPGWHTFQIHNAAAENADVDLVNPGNGAIFAEVEALGPGTTGPMRLNVGSGSYAFLCLFEDSEATTGPTVVVGGHARGTPAILPVTRNDLLAPARQYHDWVAAGLTTLAGQAGVANKLVADIRGLRASWPDLQIDLIDMGLRTHEILENALQFQLSGHDDYGSGSTLATTQANIDGTRELLTILRPLLAPRYAGLPAVDSWLDRLQSLIGKERRPNGTWVSVSALSTSQRQQIDAACSQALEVLAPIAAIAEPRRT